MIYGIGYIPEGFEVSREIIILAVKTGDDQAGGYPD
jgi:hypothetical protein